MNRDTKVSVAHRQVNILITDDYHVQLCDFGLVVVGNMTDDGWTTTAQATGTIRWMSPQRLDSMHTSYRITEADDVYALGCLYYYVSLPCSQWTNVLITRLAAFHRSRTFP
jgi:serine/threonine protein kinase